MIYVYLVLWLFLTCSIHAFVLPTFGTAPISKTSLMMSTEELPKSLDGVQNDYKSNVMTTYGRYPIAIKEGKGCRLVSTEGKEYLDFVAGISTCALGHANQRLIDAVTAQMSKVHHVSNLYYIPEQGDLAKELVAKSCADRVFFCNSGAEANEAAIKLARKHASTKLGIEDPVIITAFNCFHGRTLATITATAQPKYQQHFGPLVPGFQHTTYNDFGELESLVHHINKQGSVGAMFGKKKTGVAAIMLEPLQGEGGINPGNPEYFKAVRHLCDETGALLIMDEVQVGVGRSGKMWGYENLGIEPDVFTLAKALGGGVPIGAMLCKEHADVFQPGDHASTYGGNPLACAAGKAILTALEEDNLVQNAAERGEQLRTGLKVIQKNYPNLIKDVRGWGLITGCELGGTEELTAAKVVQAAMDAGLLLVPAGLKVVRFVPPLIVTSNDIDEALQKFSDALLLVQ
mmetsp:Transcript_28554/g.37377  ORF Transcript_28554/g.37377 Transcript_28554/m.37377 type:complete len:460 (-) Transcript_28554:313-1692(-)